MRLALESLPLALLLVLSDSSAAITSVKLASAYGHARSANLRAVVDLPGEWACAGAELHFEWVKAHGEIAGNMRADEWAKTGCLVGVPLA